MEVIGEFIVAVLVLLFRVVWAIIVLILWMIAMGIYAVVTAFLPSHEKVEWVFP